MTNKLFKCVLLLTAVLLTAVATNVYAADGKSINDSEGCGGCHGPNAKSPIMPSYPKLAGQNKEYAEQQMKDFKSGARTNGQGATMTALLASVNDEEISALADYLSNLQ